MTTWDEFPPLGNVIRGWADAGAQVTLILRNGVSLTGHVRKQQAPDLPSRVVGLVGEHSIGSRAVEHDVLLSEVVAITAVTR